MAISDKLNYLIETKDLFKDRLNSLGAEIIESTTFRNYLNWLDNFYIGSANKTDLAKNGVVGRTNQDGEPTPENPVEINNLNGDVEYKVRGKNLFDINNALNNNLYNQGTSLSLIPNGIRATTEAVANYRMGMIKIGETNKLIGKTIRVKANFSSNGNNNGRFYIGYCDARGDNRVPKSDTTTSGDTLSMVVESGSGENICLVLYSNNNGTNYTIGNYVDYKNIIMTIDNEDMTYEPYISESFPLSLKSKNLFDKNNANIIKCGISYNKINASDSNRLLYISIQPNTTYTIQRRNDGNVNRFRAGTCSIVPANGVDLDNAIETDNAESITITSRENDTYLVVMYYRTQETTLTEQQILDSIQIEENSITTDYEPYYDIELCNISNYKDQIYSQNGEFYLEKKTGKVVFDGSESWAINTSYTYNVFYRTLDNYARISNAQTTYCEYYKGIENAGGIANFGNNYNNSIGVRTANDNIKDIYISNNSITSASDFKSWLTTHNTIVYYVLATLTTTEITEENYPTLYSQLLAIQEFLTKYKINKEFLLDYSSPEIEY